MSAALRGALLALVVATGCGGPKFEAGNLKDLRERKREYREAQRQADARAAAEAETAASGEPAAAPAAGSEAAETGIAPPGAEPPGLETAVLGRLGDPFSVILAAAAGPRRVALWRPEIGHYQRDFLLAGGVEDRAVIESALMFRRDGSRFRRKLAKLDRIELVANPAGTRTGVLLRLHFRKPGKEPEDFPAEELIGAEHPSPPFVLGVGPQGPVRLPLFADGDDDFAPIREIDLTPDAPAGAEVDPAGS